MERMPLSSSEPPITPAAAAAAVPRNEPPGAGGTPAAPARIRLTGCVAWCPGGGAEAGRPVPAQWPRPTAARLALAEDAVAYSAEEALIGRRRFGCRSALEFTNTPVGPFEGFVLHQYGLDQRVEGVGRLPQAIPDEPFGLGITLGILQCGQAVEQFDDEIAFLWSHWSPPY